MCIYLIFPYLASTKCLWQKTVESAMGGRNCCIGPASVSFSIHLNIRWRCIVAKTHTGYVHESSGCSCLWVASVCLLQDCKYWLTQIHCFRNTFWKMLLKVHHGHLIVKLNGLVMHLNWDCAVCCIVVMLLHWMERIQSDLFEWCCPLNAHQFSYLIAHSCW